jgi:hypothetical protein
MSRRAANRVANETASPEANEHREKATTAMSRKDLRLPVRSEYAPPRKAATAHVKDSAEATSPTWLLLKCRSLAIIGIRKLAALRSRNTNPKVMVSTQISLVSYLIRPLYRRGDCRPVRWAAGSCSLWVESISGTKQTLEK